MDVLLTTYAIYMANSPDVDVWNLVRNYVRDLMSNSRDVDVWNPVRNPCTCIYLG